MSAGTASALTLLRVARGTPAPGEDELRAAIERDRVHLHLPPDAVRRDLRVAGPYRIVVDGQELDEYVVWDV